MNLTDFKRILISFADNSTDVEIKKGKLTAIIRGDAIEADIVEKGNELYIVEDGTESKVITWIAVRLARLEQLADRILNNTVTIPQYIFPSGNLIDDVDIDPSETEIEIENVNDCLSEKLSRRIPGTTSVLYLTSDAGEGKTTIINHLAVSQAQLFKKKESSWLLVPIPLGGRPFLRFDDIVIASLVNRLRFRLFYYESFIELVRLGLIVPAFDGFEEMFMESSSGEALSATGQLMNKLESNGNILIAARKAYFDYKNFTSQAKLFDTIGGNSVAFSKISINRWDKRRFLLYAESRDVDDPELVYTALKNTVGDAGHPLLTRPVLVNRLIDVVQTRDLKEVASELVNSSQYFLNFVDVIMRREADTKWIDTSGEPYKPLLEVSQHYILLSVIAEEMWLNNTDSLPVNIIELLTDLFCEEQGLNVRVSQQTKERIKQHALLVKSDQNPSHLKFDHEEFQQFFLGISIYSAIKRKKLLDFKNLMRKGPVYGQVVDTVVAFILNEKLEGSDVLSSLSEIQVNEGPTSFIKENCGNLAIKLLSVVRLDNVSLDGYILPYNSLVGVSLRNVLFNRCHFQVTSLSSSTIINCTFENCTFDGLDFSGDHFKLSGNIAIECNIATVQTKVKELSYYDPYNIRMEMGRNGFKVEDDNQPSAVEATPLMIEEDLLIVERALRRFIRGSQINDNVFRIRLGQSAEYFIQSLLPRLIEQNVVSEVNHQGAGVKRRFKLSIPFDKINYALKESKGSLDEFFAKLKQR
ncbi:hypothetical protein [Dyadobacter sp. 22481]|uniref:hypothetical protein n=1 Tax=Dyadobacter sp. 22481 TaxID=3453926 RepID=UPI003F853773